MSYLTQAQFEALYNSSGSGTFATNSSNNIGSASFRAFAKDISDSLFTVDNADVVFRKASDCTEYNLEFQNAASGAGAGIDRNSTFGLDNTEHALGVYDVTTGTTAAGYSYLTSNTGFRFGYGHSVVLKFRLAAQNLSDGTNTYTLYLGFGDVFAGVEPSNGAYFKYTHGTNSGKYQCVTANAGSRTATDSGVAQTTLYKTFEIRMDPAIASVVFLIDGLVVATNTTNLPPSATSHAMIWGIVKSLGATARLISLDWYNISIIRTSAR